ncbi:MAG: DEAD/DEAH box helicase family protein [Lachnospiraceae bacterium]|jgi:DNA repair protein RadD|nr:DEAD/DEAH box helicase family protein [Lachnospiraceae bacterium]
MKFKLREYQEKTKKDIEAFLENKSANKGIIVKPVGSGKSIDTAIISDLSNSKTLVIQPNIELLNQNLEKARSFGLDPSIYSASANIKNISDLTYATPQTVAKNIHHFKGFKTVVVDECHYGMTNTLKKSKISSKGIFNKALEEINPYKIMGLTATPIQLTNTRMDGSVLKMINRSRRSFWYGADIFHVTQISDVKDEYWADIEYRHFGDVDSKFLKLNSTGSEFTNESIIESYEYNNTNERILEEYEVLKSEGKKSIIIFVPDLINAEILVNRHPDFNIISSYTSAKDRKQLISDFKSGKISVLVNVGILTTGFDHPELDAIILARNTNSFGLYYQIVGRIVRPIILPDKSIYKKKAVVVDLTTNYERFGKIEDITFEKHDYTGGFAMWNNNHIMTGVPIGNWKTPSREQVIAQYNNPQPKLQNNSNKVVTKTLLEDSIKIRFGKYNGMDLEDVYKKDKKYVMWMYSNFEWKSDAQLKLKIGIEKLIHGDIQVQE